MTAPTVSVVVVSRGPSLALARLLRSLGRADRIDRAELLLGLNGDNGRPAAERLAARYLDGAAVRIVELKPTTLAQARNELVEDAAGPLLLFLDDDVEVQSDVLVQTREALEDDRVCAAGGPNLTPAASSEFERLAGRVLASALGTGLVHDRYRLAPAGPGRERRLQGCNLAIRRDAFERERFDGELVGGEENELIVRLESGGGRLAYRPELAVFHHRRGSLSGHLAQIVKYGVGRGLLIVRAPSLEQAPYLVPSIALAAVAGGGLFFPHVVGAVLAAYLLVLAAGALVIAPRRAPLAFALLLTTHVGYALGVAAGISVEAARRLWRRS